MRIERMLASNLECIFVVGGSRSGTTMMGRILNRQSRVFTFHEIHFFENLWSGITEKHLKSSDAQRLLARLLAVQRHGYLSARDPAVFHAESVRLLGSDRYPLREIYARFLQYEASRAGKSIPCDQTPRNLFYLKEIFEWYPNARVINMVRDPRDVLLSQKNKWRRRSLGAKDIPLREAARAWINYHPLTVSLLWQSAISAAERQADNRRFLTVSFERLVQEPENVVSEVCQFLGLAYDPEILNIPRKGSSTRPDIHGESGMDADRVGAWRRGGLSRTEIYICERVVGKTMDRLGIARTDSAPDWLSVSVSLLWFPAHISIAFLANVFRMRNVAAALRRRLG
jgi:hypothetical protein